MLQTLGKANGKLVFDSLSGPLSVSKAGDKLELDFPRHDVRPQPGALAKVAACFDVKRSLANVGRVFDALDALDSDAPGPVEGS